MNSKIKKILMVFMGIVALGALVVVAVVLTNQDNNQQISGEWIEGPPKLAYVSNNNTGSGLGDLHIFTVDEGEQEVAQNIGWSQFGANGQVISYQFADEQPDAPVHFIHSSGWEKILVTKSRFYDISKEAFTVLNSKRDNPFVKRIRQFASNGKVLNEGYINHDNILIWKISSNGNWIAYTKNSRVTQGIELEGATGNVVHNWADIYLYNVLTGDTQMVEEKVYLAYLLPCVSDNGAVLFLDKGEGLSDTGTLYLKEVGNEKVLLVEDAYNLFSISKDGELSTALTRDEHGSNVLFYQFDGYDPVYVESGGVFRICQDGKSLIYTVDSGDCYNTIYRVTAGAAPERIAEMATAPVAVSEDGTSVAFLMNRNEETGIGDLYVARLGKETEYIDSGVPNSSALILLGYDDVQMLFDGSAIAYLKKSDKGDTYGDLYLFEEGKEPIFVQGNVMRGFAFIQ